ncbi:Disrupted in schizophrenia 1-like [Acipenser ruthenus]|uniref:Disrupted in schizophrenia 1-like n=1 Tax=Acipenser ruthenus TaxID=7906 RepID=A0A662YTD2_ACIRT|nr:Disrupted in schizophrenia 1-like [Acipenser ruthenus]
MFYVGTRAAVLGILAVALGSQAMALGPPTAALGSQAMALGPPAAALGSQAMALGPPAAALGSQAMALGPPAAALGSLGRAVVVSGPSGGCSGQSGDGAGPSGGCSGQSGDVAGVSGSSSGQSGHGGAADAFRDSEADKFRKKLVELKRERSTLKVGLPSRHPIVSRFLERLKDQAQSALQQAYRDCGSDNEGIRHSQKLEKEVTCSSQEKTQGSIFRRGRLIQEKQQLKKEIQDLRRKLAELEVKDYLLSKEIKEEDRLIQSQDSEMPSLLNTPLSELQDMSKALDEMENSVHRNHLFTELPRHIKSLKEREQSLSTIIKEATAKVFMSQKLCSSLRKKASDIETQLPLLHDAKMVAISGNYFSTAKDLKEEIRSLSSEKDRLEELIKKLQALSTDNDRALDMTKEDYIREQLWETPTILKRGCSVYILAPVPELVSSFFVVWHQRGTQR